MGLTAFVCADLEPLLTPDHLTPSLRPLRSREEERKFIFGEVVEEGAEEGGAREVTLAWAPPGVPSMLATKYLRALPQEHLSIQVTCHLTPVTSHLSPVTCHPSPDPCHMPPDPCHLSPVSCHLTPVTCPLSPG